MLLSPQVLAEDEMTVGVEGVLTGFMEQRVHSCRSESFGKARGRLGSRHVLQR